MRGGFMGDQSTDKRFFGMVIELLKNVPIGPIGGKRNSPLADLGVMRHVVWTVIANKNMERMDEIYQEAAC
ncbi:MAG: hypothetical protein A4E64_01667 [Syntrophorhabdus sp. PtaU1.Bin058]|nr:MAG: hypothetical protein A4E64_01667 [Syntrophorhabdus sp. PtaU1.Bin058]